MPAERALPMSYAGIPAAAIGAFCVTIMILSRAFESYAGAWIAGAIALVFIMVCGSRFERGLLLLLALLSLALGTTLGYLGIRQMLFAAVFMMLARHVPLSPATAIGAYTIGLLIALVRTGEISALFTVGPSVIFLLMASWQVLQQRRNPGSPASGGRARLAVLLLSALILPLLGAGSRTGLVVWLAFGLRLLSIPTLAAGVLGILVISSFPDLHVVERAVNSYDELTNPFPEVGINLRAVEALIFLSWAQTATLREFLFGSLDVIYMPGDFLGFRGDPIYVPHNQVLGLLFQFGIVGFVAIFAYFWKYWSFLKPFPIGRFVMFVYLGVGFIVIHGFVNQDLAIVAGVALWYRQLLLAQEAGLQGAVRGV